MACSHESIAELQRTYPVYFPAAVERLDECFAVALGNESKCSLTDNSVMSPGTLVELRLDESVLSGNISERVDEIANGFRCVPKRVVPGTLLFLPVFAL